MHASLEVRDRQLRSRGYRAGAPDPRQAEVDEAICALSRCTLCGGKGLQYWPYVGPEPAPYVILAECVHCGHTREVGAEGHHVEAMQTEAWTA
jgi:hypothetical protein